LGLEEAAVVGLFVDSKLMWTGADPLREAIHALLGASGVWTGEATELLNQLRARLPFAALPSTTKGLSNVLPGIAGIRVSKSRTAHSRIITLKKLDDGSRQIGAAEAQPAATNRV
jgi:hypothetical protein